MSNLLLEWMSFRTEGRKSDIPTALCASQIEFVLNDLELLGHIERGDEGRWKVAPPVLAGLPHEPGNEVRAILCGGRTLHLMTRLASACEQASVVLHEEPSENHPNRILISASSLRHLMELSALCGIPYQDAAGYTLLACLPRLQDWPRQPCPMMRGRVELVRRFSRSQQKWVESSHEEAIAASQGFFRLKGDYRWANIIKSSATESAYIDKKAGRLLMASKLRVVSWNSGTRQLSIPTSLYPPALITRALTLCSGLLPHYDGSKRKLTFERINPEMMRLMLEITGLRLA